MINCQLQNASDSPGDKNLASAAVYLQRVLGTNNLVFRFMGGLSPILRSSPRTTKDIDLAVTAKMLQLRQIFTPQNQ
jgi:hypothetical protein